MHSAPQPDVVRREYLLRGVVQGVGFRPHVANVASRHAITGLCGNDDLRVFIEAQGTAEVIDRDGWLYYSTTTGVYRYKYTPGEKRIGLKAFREGSSVVFAVEDNGIGIDAEHQDPIFGLFYRLNPDRGGGQGLGLTIVRRVLDRQGGKIWLESTPNQGSKFFVSLPPAPLP